MDLLPKVFRTEGNIAEFDPSKIFESILKETGMSEADVKNITELVVRRIVSSGIKFLSGPHIREIVCSILSEQHFENERKLYTRIGMPLMDYEQILERGPSDKPYEQINPEKIHHWAANQIAEEYTHLRILKDEESRAHLSGEIHINHLNYFVLRPFTQIWDPRFILKYGFPPMKNLKGYTKQKPAKSLNSALYQLNKWLGIIQNEFYGKQSYNLFSTFLAPYVQNLSEEETIQEIKNFFFEINQLPLIIGREISQSSISSSCSILNETLEIPAIIPDGKNRNVYGNYQKECKRLFKALILAFKEVYQKDHLHSLPKHSILLDNKFVDLIEDIYPNFWKEIELIQSFSFVNLFLDSYRSKNIPYLSKDKFHNFGILQNISINLPRIAFISKDENKFLEILRSNLNICSNILVKKYDIIKKRIDSNNLPFCSSVIDGVPLFKLKNQSLSFSLVGLNEASKYLTNYHLHENAEAIKFSMKILSEINQICSELSEKHKRVFILSENVSEKAVNRFTKLDLKQYPNQVKFVSNNQGYTNSVHFCVNAEIELLNRIRIQEDFHATIHEGAIAYFSLNDLKRNDFNVKDFIRKISKDSRISSLKFYS
ncbi:MAG: anaerobic ribonucleoside-triphosphate reductase [Promethearchaeota archaeon]